MTELEKRVMELEREHAGSDSGSQADSDSLNTQSPAADPTN